MSVIGGRQGRRDGSRRSVDGKGERIGLMIVDLLDRGIKRLVDLGIEGSAVA